VEDIGTVARSVSAVFAQGNWNVIESAFNRTAPMELWKAATSLGTGSTISGSSLGGTSRLLLGAYNNATDTGEQAGYFMNGDMGEVLIYTTELVQADRESIEGYLHWRWGLQGDLPPAHPYKSQPPGYVAPVVSAGADGPDDIRARNRLQDVLARQRDDEDVIETVCRTLPFLCH
jgi:putative intracellular protease/amidase